MTTEPSPREIIDALTRDRHERSDQQILDELNQLPALADEDDPCWDDSAYWLGVAYPYSALAELAGERRLRAAVRLLLDRACYGDPGESMRGLRHVLERIMEPDWAALADICMDAARSDRPGTILWAVHQLQVLNDERARPLLDELTRSELEEVRSQARAALQRLDKSGRHR